MTEETSNEVVNDAQVVSDSVAEEPSKFASLYEQSKVDRAEKALPLKEEPSKEFSWKEASWADKTAKLEEMGVDYGEWTDHLAGADETENEKEWREMREWKAGEEERLSKEKLSIQDQQNIQHERNYVKTLTDIVDGDAEKYELVSSHPNKEQLLLKHARDYASKYNEVPNSEELVAFTEESILKDAKYFLKSKKLRDLILSEERDDLGEQSDEFTPTLSNDLERHSTNVEVKSGRSMESRDERIARITNR